MRQNVKYPVLKGAMAACGVTASMIAGVIHKSPSTVCAKLNGRIGFDLSEAVTIRNEFFNKISIDALFANYHVKEQCRKNGGEKGGAGK